MSKVEVLSGDHHTLWHEYLSRLPIEQQDIYFTPEYYKLYEENGDGRARCFVYMQGDDIALYPFLINNINELGYELDRDYYDIQGAYGYNGVISSSYERAFVDGFYETFSRYVVNHNIVSEFVRFHPLINNVCFSENHMELMFDRSTIKVSLEASDLAGKYHPQVRKRIRRANREGISCTYTKDAQDYVTFQKIYHDTMEYLDADEYYFFSKQYFELLNLLDSSNYRLIVAKQNGAVIGGMWVMLWGEYAHNHLSAAMTNLRNTGVNVIIQHSVIEYAKNHGAKYLHLGGGRTGHEDDSLLGFKKNFSKEHCDFFIGKKVHNLDVYNKVVKQWEELYPIAAKKYGNMLQGYRKLDA